MLAFLKKSFQISFFIFLFFIFCIPLSTNAQNQTQTDVILGKAIQLFQEGNYLDAYIELEAILKIDPNNAQALNYKFQCESNLGGLPSVSTASPSPDPALTEITPIATPQLSPQPSIAVTSLPEDLATPSIPLQPSPTNHQPIEPNTDSKNTILITPLISPTKNQQLFITDPPGWVKQSISDPSQIAYFQLPNQQRIVIAELIVFQESLESDKTPEEYLEYIQKNRLKPPEFELYVPLESKPTTLAGLPAVQHDFLFSNGTLQLRARAVLVIYNKLAYSFLFYSSIADFNQLETHFNQVLEFVSTEEKNQNQPSHELSFVSQAGHFGIHVPLPQGTTLKETSSIQTIYNGPNQSLIEIVASDLVDQLKQAEAKTVSGKSFQNQSNLSVGSQVIEIKLYQYFENNRNFALLTARYVEKPLLIIIYLPQDEYQTAQSWLTQLIQSVNFS
ncbi:MAG: hypothetical protein GX428_06485 [Candidatus Atribacteria bacterium]|nr:hypothetical protein [Candidatus Atribacteria bacterium]